MKKVRFARSEEKPEEKLLPVKFTHRMIQDEGWMKLDSLFDMSQLGSIEDIVYLGNCSYDGDMFAVYYSVGSIEILKGELNDGIY